MSVNTPLSSLRSCLVFSKCVRPIWEKAWSRSENTAPIVIAPDGGPRAGWTPASQRSALLWLSHSRPAWSALPGDSQGCVSQLTQSGAGDWCSRPKGGFVGSIPMRERD